MMMVIFCSHFCFCIRDIDRDLFPLFILSLHFYPSILFMIHLFSHADASDIFVSIMLLFLYICMVCSVFLSYAKSTEVVHFVNFLVSCAKQSFLIKMEPEE